MAPLSDRVTRPRNWGIAISAAYLRLIGLTIEESAKGAGCGERTLKRWEASQWWPDAQEEATDRWLQATKGEARRGLLKSIRAGDAASQRWLLERTDIRLAPPAQQHEIFIDYLHRTDVVELARGMASDVMEVVQDPELREAIAERFRLRLERHTNSRRGSQGQRPQLPPGEQPEGGEV